MRLASFWAAWSVGGSPDAVWRVGIASTVRVVRAGLFLPRAFQCANRIYGDDELFRLRAIMGALQRLSRRALTVRADETVLPSE